MMRALARNAKGRIREVILGWWQKISLRLVEKANPILIYQMGKVGSSTISTSIGALNLNVPVLHVHTLTPDGLQHAIQRQRSSSRSALDEHLVLSRILVPKIQRSVFPARIITLTREPVARAVSFVLEDVAKQAPEALVGRNELDRTALENSILRLLSSDNGVADPSLWFDRELKASFGIDVFSEPYDFKKGYAIIRGAKHSALVIRLEDLNARLPSALAEYLHIDPDRVTVEKSNVGEVKWYADDLAFLKQTLRIPRNLADAIAGTRYYRHFYGASGEDVMRRWVE